MTIDLHKLAKPTAIAAALAAALSLTACNRQHDDRTVGQKVDDTIQRTEQSADNAKREASTAMNDARQDAKQAAADASDKVADAAITASVNADLAKDPDLSALKINVDTSNGHVTLHGTAPNEDAKQRASKLASNVKGVTSVDNELSIQR
jgi:osmotically-inducible protein OsmY